MARGYDWLADFFRRQETIDVRQGDSPPAQFSSSCDITDARINCGGTGLPRLVSARDPHGGPPVTAESSEAVSF